jgi:hypothetical protein
MTPIAAAIVGCRMLHPSMATIIKTEVGLLSFLLHDFLF